MLLLLPTLTFQVIHEPVAVLANCYEPKQVVATLRGGETVAVNSSFAGADFPCYSVTVTREGAALRGYLSDITHPAVAAFERERRSVSAATVPGGPPRPAESGGSTKDEVVTEPAVYFPDVAGMEAGGKSIQLSRVQKKVTLVTFWNPANAGSLAAIKALGGLVAEFNLRGLGALGITNNPDKGKVNGALDDTPVNWPQLIDKSGLAERFHAAPGTTLVLDGDRRVVAAGTSAREIEKTVRALLAKP